MEANLSVKKKKKGKKKGKTLPSKEWAQFDPSIRLVTIKNSRSPRKETSRWESWFQRVTDQHHEIEIEL